MPLCPPCSIIPKNLCLLPKLQGAYDTSFSLHTTALSFRTYFHFWDVYSHCLNLSKYEAEGKHSFTESMRSVKYKVTILTLSFTEDNSLHRIFALIWYLSAYFLICKNQVTTSTRKLFQDTIANKNIKNWYSVYTIRKLSLSKGFTHTHTPLIVAYHKDFHILMHLLYWYILVLSACISNRMFQKAYPLLHSPPFFTD